MISRNHEQDLQNTINILNEKLDAIDDLKDILLNQKNNQSNTELTNDIKLAMEEAMKRNMDDTNRKIFEQKDSEINNLKEELLKINQEKDFLKTDLESQLKNVKNQLVSSQEYCKKLDVLNIIFRICKMIY